MEYKIILNLNTGRWCWEAYHTTLNTILARGPLSSSQEEAATSLKLFKECIGGRQ